MKLKLIAVILLFIKRFHIVLAYKWFMGALRIFLFAFLSLPVFAELNPDLLLKAERGDAASQYLIGIAYFGSVGVEKDYEKAFEWLLKSATQNFPDAQV
ncbi:MAG: hypothetical protein LRY51_16785, partial [Geovibrio sp.]|nr:hypothetical protein [Geovibrio sp.]